MKHSLFVSLLFVVLCFFSLAESLKRVKREEPAVCDFFYCARLGEKCGSSQTATLETEIECKNGFSCTTKDGEGQCIPSPQVGDSCEQTDDCANGLDCSSTSPKTCLDYSESVQPGEACIYDSQCSFRNRTDPTSFEVIQKCDNGKCFYIQDGGQCEDDQCNDLTSYCSVDRVCTPYVALGGACELVDAIYPCGENLRCQPFNVTTYFGTCQYDELSVAGDTCTEDSECLETLFCNATTIEGAKSDLGVCTPYANTSTWRQPCTYDSDCTENNGEICGCDNFKEDRQLICIGENNRPVGYNKAGVEYNICGESHPECGSNKTCSLLACITEACALYSLVPEASNCEYDLLNPYCHFNSTSSPSPSPSPPPSDQTSSASSQFFCLSACFSWLLLCFKLFCQLVILT